MIYWYTVFILCVFVSSQKICMVAKYQNPCTVIDVLNTVSQRTHSLHKMVFENTVALARVMIV